MNRATWWDRLEAPAVARVAELDDVEAGGGVSLTAPRNTKNSIEGVTRWRGVALLSDLEVTLAERLAEPRAWWRDNVEQCPVQPQGLDESRGLILFHGTGTGKTLKSLAVAFALAAYKTKISKTDPEARVPWRVLVITDNSIKAAFEASALRNLEGCAYAQAAELFAVHNYEAKEIHADNNDIFEHADKTILIFDEAHYRLRRDADDAKKTQTDTLVKLATAAGYALLLTATPTTSSPSNFLDLLRVIDRAALVPRPLADAAAFEAWFRCVLPLLKSVFESCGGIKKDAGAATAALLAFFGAAPTSQQEETQKQRHERVRRRAAMLMVLPHLVGRVSFEPAASEEAERLSVFPIVVRSPSLEFERDAAIAEKVAAKKLRRGFVVKDPDAVGLNAGDVMRVKQGKEDVLYRLGPKIIALFEVCDEGLSKTALTNLEVRLRDDPEVTYTASCATQERLTNDVRLVNMMEYEPFKEGIGKVVVYTEKIKAAPGPALLALLRARYPERLLVFRGGKEGKNRDEIAESFNASKEPLILLMTPAGEHGLDLKGVAYVVLMSSPQSKARVEQIFGRAVRVDSHKGYDFSHVVGLQFFGSEDEGKREGDDNIDCMKELAKLCSVQVLQTFSRTAADATCAALQK